MALLKKATRLVTTETKTQIMFASNISSTVFFRLTPRKARNSNPAPIPRITKYFNTENTVLFMRVAAKKKNGLEETF
jgi:hypothetical protein